MRGAGRDATDLFDEVSTAYPPPPPQLCPLDRILLVARLPLSIWSGFHGSLQVPLNTPGSRVSQRKVSFPRTQQNAELLDAEPSAVTKRSLHLPSKRFYVSLKMVDSQRDIYLLKRRTLYSCHRIKKNLFQIKTI